MEDNIDKIIIEIYDGENIKLSTSFCPVRNSEECAFSTVKEQVEDLKQEMRKTFGGSIEVKYIDTNTEGMDENGFCQKILDKGYSYPITMFNGQPRIAGAVNIALIRQSLDQIAFELIKDVNESARNGH